MIEHSIRSRILRIRYMCVYLHVMNIIYYNQSLLVSDTVNFFFFKKKRECSVVSIVHTDHNVPKDRD